MSTHKNFDRICIFTIILALVLTAGFMNGRTLGIPTAQKVYAYEDQLFDTTKVHKIDIRMDNWESFIKKSESKKYESCTIVINGESYKNIGIRTKGSNSLEYTSKSKSNRYSFKIKFNKYEKALNYHGLDKLNLNNISQDNTYMKDYLTYQMMRTYKAKAPLCSYVEITVNGKAWGLYLAVEDVADSFLKRNYGSDHGKLYKPDGIGEDYDEAEQMKDVNSNEGEFKNRENDEDMDESTQTDDTSLIYIDDNPDSYAGIFQNAKTKITATDKKRLVMSLKWLGENKGIKSIVNIDEVLRYFVVHNYVVNEDSYTGTSSHNYYLYEKNGMLSMIPWDYNLAFGAFDDNDTSSVVNDPIDTPLPATSLKERPMLAWILTNDNYKELYHQYFNTFLDNTDIIGLIDDTATLIAPYVEKDPSKFCTYEQFKKGVDTLKKFCRLRMESIKGQLNGAIPSDSAGQAAEKSKLIDASNIELFDMGILIDFDMDTNNFYKETPVKQDKN